MAAPENVVSNVVSASASRVVQAWLTPVELLALGAI